MKKLLNKKLIIPVLLIIFVLVIVVLYIIGFRITYAPELENSWEAVSAVATCVGVLASFMAIWFAVQVPKKIAEQQNKIALFEKRHKLYKQFAEFYNFSLSVGYAFSSERIQELFFKYYGPWNNDNLDNSEEVHKRIIKLIFEFSEAEFLFNEEIAASIIMIVNKVSTVIYTSINVNKHSQINTLQNNLLKELKSEKCIDILEKMEKYLQLKN